MGEAIQIVLGASVLIGFWWGMFALIRIFEPRPRPAPGPARSADLSAGRAAPRSTAVASRLRATPCCPDCAVGCQITGLAGGQAWGGGDGWWGQPFGDDGPNTEAMAFWGDECCPDCSRCPICQGTQG